MTPPLDARTPVQRAPELAPYWHTAALVGLLLSVAIAGTLLQWAGRLPAHAASPGPAQSRIWLLYLPVLFVNWGLAWYACRLFRTRSALPGFLGRRWLSWGQAGLDLLLALAVCALVQGSEMLTAHYLATPDAGRNAALAALHPRTGAERLTWVFVAANVGFCEEVVYRGYLQTQLSALTGHAGVGILLQALLFGVAHAEQGWASSLRIAVYGLGLGCLAAARRSLLPSIVSHIAIDVASGLLG